MMNAFLASLEKIFCQDDCYLSLGSRVMEDGAAAL